MTEAAKILAQFEANAIELETAAETATGFVLAWNTGLGVNFDADGKPFACGVLHAKIIVSGEEAAAMPEEAWAYTPIVHNGLKEQASIMPRKQALLEAAKRTRETIAFCKGHL